MTLTTILNDTASLSVTWIFGVLLEPKETCDVATPSALCWKELGLCFCQSPREGVPSPRAHWKHTLVSTGLTGTHLPLQEQVAGSGPFAPRYDISHSSGKWLGFFFFLSRHEWPTLGRQLHTAPSACEGSRAGC